ncbi:porin family protein [Aurantibacter aestuarii]|uniref:PorT family protein n=1 Tax=Aurantibacter aestuarii TaxID=1266046 RepID=A0A2T1N9S3_9FLAO|nr:porin family protein [Aurantibacter aestuarii]PSG88573.1 PorT family protein [Aurantibacter aestuarii]
MKKIILNLSLLFSLLIVNAQDDVSNSTTNVSFGIKAGLNLADLSGEDIAESSSKLGFHIGGVAEIMISDKFSIQPELIFSQQGTESTEKESGTFEGGSFSIEEETILKLNYLNLPVLAKFYVVDGFSLEAGPQVGFLLSADLEYDYRETVTFDGETITDTESAKATVKNEFKGIDFGLGFGANFKLNMGLNFGLRYNLGLTSIAEDDEDGEAFDVKNNVLQFSVGYSF